MPPLYRLIWGSLAAICLGTIMLLSVMIWQLPSKEELLSLELKRPARLWTQERWLIGEIGDERRYPISIEQIPLKLQQAFIAVEDARFYEHGGVDFKSLIRAFWIDLAAKKKLQGGSTISMQVARNFFLHRQKTYWRKIQEILLAWRIEQYLTKKQVLELYLNKIFLGHRNFGVVAAAQFYFGKNLDQLSTGEIAILAGLPKAPSYLNPLASTERCEQRRNSVLLKMYQHEFITQKSYSSACAEIIHAVSLSSIPQLHDPMLLEYLKKQLEKEDPQALARGDDILTTISGSLQLLASQSLDEGLLRIMAQQKLQPSERQPTEEQPPLPESFELCTILENHGIKVKIQLDSGPILLLTPRSEKISETLFKERYLGAKAGSLFYYDHQSQRLISLSDLQGAVVILGPGAELLALVGSSSWSDSFFNRATQTRRPIASTVKSLIFAQAFDQGYQLNDLIEDAPFVSTDQQGFQWRPQNHNHRYQGTLSLEQAYLRSANLATLRLTKTLDLSRLNLALSMATKQPLSPLPESFALGSYECSPLELTQLYQAFNSRGQFPKSVAITPSSPTQWEELCSEQSAYVTRYLQERFFDRISPQKIKNSGGKTGTSNNFQDLWFAGYQQGLSCVVWVGFDQPRSTELYAVRGAFPIWKKIALKSSAAYPDTKKPPLPSRIRLEKQSGGLRPVIVPQPAHQDY